MTLSRLLYETIAATTVSTRLRSLSAHAHRADVSKWIDLLDDLGLDDITDARMHLHRAQELQDEARKLSTSPHRDTALVRDLAAGEMTTGDAAVVLAEQRQAHDATHASEQRRMLQRAADTALGLAASSLHSAGDRLITDTLRPVINELLEEATQTVASLPDSVIDEGSAKRTGNGTTVATWYRVSQLEARFDQAHGAAHRLRQAGILPTCGASRTEHSFARPDLRHAWRVAHANHANRVGHAMSKNGDLLAVMHVHGTATPLNLAQIVRHPEWRPGILTASEVVENLQAIASIDTLPIVGRYEPEAAA